MNKLYLTNSNNISLSKLDKFWEEFSKNSLINIKDLQKYLIIILKLRSDSKKYEADSSNRISNKISKKSIIPEEKIKYFQKEYELFSKNRLLHKLNLFQSSKLNQKSNSKLYSSFKESPRKLLNLLKLHHQKDSKDFDSNISTNRKKMINNSLDKKTLENSKKSKGIINDSVSTLAQKILSESVPKTLNKTISNANINSISRKKSQFSHQNHKFKLSIFQNNQQISSKNHEFTNEASSESQILLNHSKLTNSTEINNKYFSNSKNKHEKKHNTNVNEEKTKTQQDIRSSFKKKNYIVNHHFKKRLI